MKDKKEYIVIASIIGLLITGIALSFAYFNINGKQDISNTFRSGCLNVTIESESDALTLGNTKPITI